MSSDDRIASDSGARGEPLSELAYQKLREDILRADVPPDSKLKIEVLQQRYSLSNTPLREALNRLVAERLVVADERRGFRVMPVSLRQFVDLTEFRYVVEEGALLNAITHGGDDWEAGVVAAFHRLEAVEKRVTLSESSSDDEWRIRHKALHMALLLGCTSQRLVSTCAAVFDEAERYRCFAAKLARSERHAGDEHRRIMEAALERDARLATALMRNHVKRTADHVAEMLHELRAVPARG